MSMCVRPILYSFPCCTPLRTLCYTQNQFIQVIRPTNYVKSIQSLKLYNVTSISLRKYSRIQNDTRGNFFYLHPYPFKYLFHTAPKQSVSNRICAQNFNRFPSVSFQVSYFSHQIPVTRNKQTISPLADAMDNINDLLTTCGGCGAQFQTDFIERSGFIKAAELAKWKKKLKNKLDDLTKKNSISDYDMATESSRILPTEMDINNVIYTVPEEEKDNIIDYKDLLALYKKRVEEEKILRCMRCHQLENYGNTRGRIDSVKADDFQNLLTSIFLPPTAEPCVIIKLVDLFDCEGSAIRAFGQMVGRRHSVILVGNKVDLLPMKLRFEKRKAFHDLRLWLKDQTSSMAVKCDAINIISAEKGLGIERLIGQINRLSRGVKNIFIVGAINAGKSTLINKLIQIGYLKSHGDWLKSPRALKSKAQRNKITTSRFPGTTLGLLGFPLTNSELTLYDTPGLIRKGNLFPLLKFDELRALLPRKRIIPVTYRIKVGKSLLLGSMVRVDFLQGQPSFFSVCASKFVTIHITNIETVKEMFHRNATLSKFGSQGGKGQMLAPPFDRKRLFEVGLGNFSQRYQDLEINGHGWMNNCRDVAFPGIGWISITTSGNIKIRVYSSGGTMAVSRKPIVPISARETSQRWKGSTIGHKPTNKRKRKRRWR